MNLRLKSMLGLAAVLIAACAVIWLVAGRTLLGKLEAEEQRRVLQVLEHAGHHVDAQVGNLAMLAGDWAMWDDTWSFIAEPYPEWIAVNTNVESLDLIEVDLLALVDSAGRLVFARVPEIDATGDASAATTETVRRLVAALPPVADADSPSTAVSGLLNLGGEVWMLSAQPVLKSDGGGPVRGRLLMARRLAGDRCRRLVGASGMDFELWPAGSPVVRKNLLPSERERILNDGEVLVRDEPDRALGGYTAITDLTGRAALVVATRLPRDLYSSGVLGVRAVLFAFMAFVLVVGLVGQGMLQHRFFTPIERLRHAVLRIRRADDPVQRVNPAGMRCLTPLSSAVNEMLDSCAAGMLAEGRHMQRYQTMFRQAGDGMFVFEPAGKRIIEANQSFMRILGYREDEIERLRLYDVAAQAPEAVDEEVRRHLSGGSGLVGDRVFRRKDGMPVNVQLSANLLDAGGQELVFVLMRDVTETRAAETQLQETVEHLERFNRLAVGRELRMIKLKEEVNELLDRLGEPPRYKPGASSGREPATEDRLTRVG